MNNPTDKMLWKPSPERIDQSGMRRFADHLQTRLDIDVKDYSDLHAWSVNRPEEFWSEFWDYCSLSGEKSTPLIADEEKMPGAKFFPNGTLNFAQNVLSKTGTEDALVFRGEDKIRSRWSWDDLHQKVSQLQQAFVDMGVGKGDRVAAMLPNIPEAIAAMLATSSIGAIWSSCSPDFGVKGVLDRFAQIEPSVFIACDGYWYNGKPIDIIQKVAEICSELKSAKPIVVPYLDSAESFVNEIDNGISFPDCISKYPNTAIHFEPLNFNHPLYILFSSGTTGVPKCIVHSQGGVLLQHLKEHRLHCDIKPGDRVFHFTTCGWMMWNWLASALASKATLMLYDGSPFYPDGNILFDYAKEEKFNFFGTSAKFIDAVRNVNLNIKNSHNLPSLRTMSSTGSPLSDENFKFVYSHIKSDIHLASMSGGTDIVACFVGGVPILPVYTGEIQGPALAMATRVYSDFGKPINSGKGELVCDKPFPSIPLGFWNDPDGSKFHDAYFDRFENVWCHGDFAEWTQTGGMIIHGRSDATLNPGGVRIGTAEIYNVVEQMDEIDEAICIGHKWPGGQGDVRIVLFVVCANATSLDANLVNNIKQNIREGASPRHVPSLVIRVDDIPRTKSGKITELAVSDVVHGREVKNIEALANPQALELYRNLPELV